MYEIGVNFFMSNSFTCRSLGGR